MLLCLISRNELISPDFLDHLIREYPATQHATTKRAYFFENLHEMEGFEQASREQMLQLGSTGATVYRGIFQTIRPSPVSPPGTLLVLKRY